MYTSCGWDVGCGSSTGIAVRRVNSSVDVLSDSVVDAFTFSALTPLVGRQEEHSACKKLSDEVQALSSVWNKVQMICIWSS